VNTVTVGDAELTLIGPKAALAKVASLNELPPAAAMVPSFVRAWRPVGDGKTFHKQHIEVTQNSYH
jgi:hypothetical protein